MITKIKIEDFPFTPRCPVCKAAVAYRVAPHDVSICPLKVGEVVLSDELKRVGVRVEDTLEYQVMLSYAQYPSLYGRTPWSRWNIFNHFFFVVGNGYRWYKGSLTEYSEDRPTEVKWLGYEPDAGPTALEEALEAATTRKDYEEVDRLIVLRQEERKKATVYYYYPGELERHNRLPDYFYPISEKYSAITKVPKNVQADWLTGCYEALAMLEYVPGDDKTDKEGHNLKKAPNIRRKLDAITNGRASSLCG